MSNPIPLGVNFQINSIVQTRVTDASVHSLSDGGFIVTWQAWNGPDSQEDVFAQRYDNQGGIVGSEFQVNTHTSLSQTVSSVASLPSGGFVVVWESLGQDGPGSSIFGQVFNSAGQKIGGEIPVNDYTTSQQKNPEVTALSDGNFVVTWQSTLNFGDSWGVYAQVFNAAGDPVGDEIEIKNNASIDEALPVVTSLSNGDFVIVWDVGASGNVVRNAFGQRFNNSGDAVGNEFQINSTQNVSGALAITTLTDGSFVVTWDGGDIYARRFDSNAVPEGEEFQVDSEQNSAEGYPSITSLADGGFIVFWDYYNPNTSEFGIAGQRFDRTTDPIETQFSVGMSLDQEPNKPTVSGVNDGGFVVAWHDLSGHYEGGQFGIFGQRYEPQTFGGRNNDLLVDDLGTDWIDGRGGDDEIYGGLGDDFLFGSAGDDFIYGEVGDDTISGGADNDHLYGGVGVNNVSGDSGNDYIRAGNGADNYDGGSGKDYLSYYDSPGGVTLDLRDDVASGSWASNDTITGFESAAGSKTGADIIRGTNGSNTIKTYGGNDRVYDRKGDDLVRLGIGDDYVRVGGGVDNFDGGDGKDYISYYNSTGGVTLDLLANTASGSWAANDTIKNFESASGSKTGGDTIRGTNGSNTIKTYGGDDNVYDRSGDDIVKLGNGDDYVRVGGGIDTFDGGDGKDYISYYSSPNGVALDLAANIVSGSWAADDVIASFESASGSKTGDDLIKGTVGSNTIKTYGGNDEVYDRGGDDVVKLGGGNDYVKVGGGKDEFDGGSGKDYISYFNSTGGVTLNLETNTASGSWAANDIVKNFESASGSNVGGDLLTGTEESNTLKGYGGDDTIFGMAADDVLSGGTGEDKLYGGAGDDKIYGGSGNDYLKGHSGEDYLKGHSGDDRLRGGSGDDRLRGGEGNDLLEGEGGNDTFIFDENWGNDTIKNFDVSGTETLDFSNIAEILQLSDLTISYDEDNTIISFGADIIVLEDSIDELLVDDFIFA